MRGLSQSREFAAENFLEVRIFDLVREWLTIETLVQSRRKNAKNIVSSVARWGCGGW
jgi:hypothetical protein